MRQNLSVIFDVDGVLIDGWHADPARRRPWDANLESDLGIDRSAFQERFFGIGTGRATAPMSLCIKGERSLDEALAEILPSVGFRGKIDDFIAYWFERDSNINRGVLDIVQTLKRKGSAELYIATGQEHRRASYLWNRLGFRDHFDAMFYSAQLGLAKKDIRFFEAIDRRLGPATREAPLFFDDQPEIVEIAKRAGWDAYCFNSLDDLAGNPRIRAALSA